MSDKYKVETLDETYFVKADSSNKARKEVFKKEGITMVKEEFETDDSTGDWIYLEQDDPDWKDVKIGNTTIGKDGCLVTNLSMMSYWYGDFFTPADIAKKVSFTNNGWYIWKSGDCFLPFNFVYRYYNRDVKKIKDILYSKDNAVIVRVRNHWLAVIGFDEKNEKFIGADPLTGDSCYIEDRYRLIDGFAEISRNK